MDKKVKTHTHDYWRAYAERLIKEGHQKFWGGVLFGFSIGWVINWIIYGR